MYARDGILRLCADYDVPDADLVYFLNYTLKADEHQLYDGLNKNNTSCSTIDSQFKDHYASLSKQREISDILTHITIYYCRMLDDDDDRDPLERLITKMNSLIQMAKEDDRDE